MNSLGCEDKPRLITLIGPPGIGKTQCALFTLRYLRDRAHNFNIGAIYCGDMLAHMSGKRRRRRTKETFHDIVIKAVGGAGGGDIREVLNRICVTPCVLLLDGCDCWLSSTNLNLAEEVENLAIYCRKLTIVVTARVPLSEGVRRGGGVEGGSEARRAPANVPVLTRNRSSNQCYGEIVMEIPRLNNYDCAQLLNLKSPRKFSLPELYGGLYVANSAGKIDAMQSFSDSQVVRNLNGNPQLVEAVVGMLPNLLEFENKILNEIIPETKQKLRKENLWHASCGPFDHGKLGDVGFWFKKMVGEDTGREMKDDDFSWLVGTACEKEIGGKFLDISLKRGDFEKLYGYWENLAKIIERVGDSTWKSNLVKGFISRDECHNILKSEVSGSFIVRFSTEVNCLAVVVKTVNGSIIDVKLKPTESKHGWSYGGEEFTDLVTLIGSTDACERVVISLMTR